MTPFLWTMIGGSGLGIIVAILCNAGKKKHPVAGLISFILAAVCIFGFVLDITINPYKNGYVPPEEEVGVVSFDELYWAYKDNEIVADEKYEGNRYYVTGEIAGINNGGILNIGGGATLTVNVQVDNITVVLIATFDDTQIENLKTVKVGDTITFAGKCLSYGSWSDCELILED